MQAQQLNLNDSNNIANEYDGFKKNKIEFQDSYIRTPDKLVDKLELEMSFQQECWKWNQSSFYCKDFHQGKNQTSENDVAIDGTDFSVEKPDGTEAYTRDGAFKVGPDGQITTVMHFLPQDCKLIRK